MTPLLRTPFLPALLLGAAVAAAFWPATGFDFLPFDDHLFVFQNETVLQGLTPRGVGYALTNLDSGAWLPAVWLSLMADASLFGPAPWGFHLTNILLHAASMALLLVLLWKMTGEPARSCLAAALVALHPLRVESVAWVSERKDVLSLFFVLLALACYLAFVRKKGWGWMAGTAGAFCLAMMSKPTVAVFPLLLLALDHWPLRRLRGAWRERLREKLPMLALAAAFALLALANLPAGQDPVSLATRTQRAALAPFSYLASTLWPVGLGFAFFDPARETARPLLTTLAVLGLAGLSGAAFWARERQPWLATGWVWYLVALAPVSGFLSTGAQWLAGRYTYLPHLGLSLALVWGAASLWQRREKGKALPAVLAVLVLALLAVSTRSQLAWWRNEVTLTTRMSGLSPGDPVPREMLGNALLRRGDADGALRLAGDALALDPGYAPALRLRARVFAQAGKTDEAISDLEKALLARDFPNEVALTHLMLAELLARAGRGEEARAHLEQAGAPR